MPNSVDVFTKATTSGNSNKRWSRHICLFSNEVSYYTKCYSHSLKELQEQKVFKSRLRMFTGGRCRVKSRLKNESSNMAHSLFYQGIASIDFCDSCPNISSLPSFHYAKPLAKAFRVSIGWKRRLNGSNSAPSH